MGLVTHKYLVDAMSNDEFRATFAAREHTVDYILGEIRKQSCSDSLTSFLVTGPRGVGKTSLVRMICMRIREEPDLAAAWIPVRLPEEVPGMTCLRDLFAYALRTLAQDSVSEAAEHATRADAEGDDRRSQGLALDGLRTISREQHKRFVLVVENFDQVLKGWDTQDRAALRSALSIEPFMMVLATAVRTFESLEQYDEPLFNYFCPAPLERLNDAQVHAILSRRAAFDGNAEFEAQYRENIDKIKVITRLTGGNPRLAVLLYEALTVGNLRSLVKTLFELVDGLTPLLKDVIEHQLTPQQGKVLDALMRAGGTATPSGLARAARLPLNVVTTQLGRLEQAQIVTAVESGKGPDAYYEVPDALFRTWYSRRILRPFPRRLELFIEFVRAWFAEEERVAGIRTTLEDVASPADIGQARGVAEASPKYRAGLEATAPGDDDRGPALAWAESLRASSRSGSLDPAIGAVAAVLGSLAPDDRLTCLAGILRELASPDMRAVWPRICRTLLDAQPPEILERVDFIRPLCDVLETNDTSKLAPLPPEQREFLLEVLKKFEDTADAGRPDPSRTRPPNPEP